MGYHHTGQSYTLTVEVIPFPTQAVYSNTIPALYYKSSFVNIQCIYMTNVHVHVNFSCTKMHQKRDPALPDTILLSYMYIHVYVASPLYIQARMYTCKWHPCTKTGTAYTYMCINTTHSLVLKW